MYMVLDDVVLNVDEDALREFTPGLMKARGVFETLRVTQGKALFWKEHILRLKKSLRALQMPFPAVENILSRRTAQLIDLNHIDEGRLRLSVWTKHRKIHWAVCTAPWKGMSPRKCLRGLKMIIAPQRIDESDPGVSLKMMAYRPYYQSFLYAQTNGYDEALLLNSKKEIVEGSRTNIFWVSDGLLFTPALKTGCLPGIVRSQVLKIARRKHIPCRTVCAQREIFSKAEEAFLTNSLLGIVPLAEVGGVRIGRNKKKGITGILENAYRKLGG